MEAMRLWISGTLEDCYSRSIGLTYDQGPLRCIKSVSDDVLNPDTFKIVSISLYGFGGESALTEQQTKREEVSEIVNSRRQVDKRQFVQSDFDREFLLGNTFKVSNEKELR